MPGPIDTVKAQSEATGRIIDSLSDADFAKDSPGCPGWNVGTVVTHLTVGARLFAGSAAGDKSVWERREEHVKAVAGATPAEMKRHYADASREFISTLESLSPAELQSKTATHPAFGEIPVARLAGMRVSEATIHSWDIEAARNPDAKLEGPGVQMTLDAIGGGLPMWFLPDQIGGFSRSYRLVAGNFDRRLTVDEGKASWAEGAGQADVTLTMDPGDLALLIAGRLSTDKLVSSGRARIEGDPVAARAFSTLFRAYDGR